MEEKYCALCGGEKIQKSTSDEAIFECVKCGQISYPHSVFCVICLIEFQNRFLICRQKRINQSFSLISGYVQKNETLEDCVQREIREETKLEIEKLQYIKSYVFEEKNLIMCGFYVRVKDSEIELNEEIDEAVWVPFNEAKHFLRETKIAIRLMTDYEE